MVQVVKTIPVGLHQYFKEGYTQYVFPSTTDFVTCPDGRTLTEYMENMQVQILSVESSTSEIPESITPGTIYFINNKMMIGDNNGSLVEVPLIPGIHEGLSIAVGNNPSLEGIPLTWTVIEHAINSHVKLISSVSVPTKSIDISNHEACQSFVDEIFAKCLSEPDEAYSHILKQNNAIYRISTLEEIKKKYKLSVNDELPNNFILYNNEIQKYQYVTSDSESSFTEIFFTIYLDAKYVYDMVI